MPKKFNPKIILKKYNWRQWLQRPLFAFMVSLFYVGNTKENFKKVGIADAEWEAFLFDHGYWYECDEVYEKIKPALEKWMKGHSITEITSRLDDFYKKEKKIFLDYAKNPEKDLHKKLMHFREVMNICIAYIWLAHGLEYCFNKKLKSESVKYVKPDKLSEFISSASVPKKLTASEKMDRAILSGMPFEKVAEEFGWIRCRDGFCNPYTAKDIAEFSKTIKPADKRKAAQVPVALKKLFFEARELVYFRTQRTDVWYELIYFFRPVLKVLAKKYNIKFSDLKYYTLESLINGKPKRFAKKFGVIGYKDRIFYFDKPLIKDAKKKSIAEVKGMTAQKGKFTGHVKIVVNLKDLKKVKAGDVLVTFMTAPNFLPGMRLAGAFVTNEGGLTCHAAIIAREMKKPCIIGTKIATQVFKDGDVVEVDADKGVVELL
jgi:phosphohistidine swiveling domain-containing protein